MSYAIKNRRTGKFIWGTDFRYHPPHQRTSKNMALVYDDYERAKFQLQHRGCGREYEIVPVMILELAVKEQEHA